VVLQKSLDIYNIMSLTIILFEWVIHWLVFKRTKGLIGEENRNVKEHFRLIVLYLLLIAQDFCFSYIFWEQFRKHGNQMSDIYLILGFECIRILIKSIEECFKYHVSLFELYYAEQWLEKKFVFNCVSLVFDFMDMVANIRVFMFIMSRGALPIYLLGEIVDNFTRLATSLHALWKWRQFIKKLKKLKNVKGSDPDKPPVEGEEELPEIQCCICLHSIRSGKELSCGHKFHLSCLRSWLIEKVECPTCRKPVELDKPQENNV
jgi:E3 ubiquitin-protein ligase synoviolin